MARIQPIHGVRYSAGVPGGLGAALSPPYDVLSSEEVDALYDASPYNVIRLEHGRQLAGDGPAENRYTRAARLLRKWLAEGVLAIEPKRSLYLHRQSLTHDGCGFSRLGIMGGLELEEWVAGVVLPHETTLPKPKADRLQLMRACRCNVSPIMVLYEDRSVRAELEHLAASRPADIRATGAAGEVHELWVLSEPSSIRAVQDALAPQPVFIADGHHRYETALEYRREIEASGGSLSADHPSKFALCTLYDAQDPGLIVLPTHRLVDGLEELTVRALEQRLQGEFSVSPVGASESPDALARAQAVLAEHCESEHAFAFFPRGGSGFVATVERSRARALGLVATGAEAYRSLDLAVLHDYVLDRLLGIGAERLLEEGLVTYTRDAAEAVAAVSAGRQQLAVLVNPTPVGQLLAVARAGGRMPQKSTYFFPKLPTGLVINPLEPLSL